MERTFLMVKPDGVRRGLVGEVIGRFERKGLSLRRMRLLTIDEEMARRHYAEHVDKPFFGELVAFITSGPVVATISSPTLICRSSSTYRTCGARRSPTRSGNSCAWSRDTR